MQKSYNVYHNLGYWLLSFIVLAFAGFYTSYFSVISTHPSIVHIHFTLMALWIIMLITQPFLVKYKRHATHRLLGKVSYVLVPLVLLSGFLMIRHSYYLFIADLIQKAGQGSRPFSRSEVLQQAADYETIAFCYLVWFMSFYILAVRNRRRTPVHSRYMLATALALLGPFVDRIIFYVFKLEKLPGSLPVESVSFIIIDAVLTILLIHDHKNKKPTRTLWTCLFIYITGQVFFFTVPGMGLWEQFMTFIMRPA